MVRPLPFRELVRAPDAKFGRGAKTGRFDRFFGNSALNFGGTVRHVLRATPQARYHLGLGPAAARGLLPLDCHNVCSDRASAYFLIESAKISPGSYSYGNT